MAPLFLLGQGVPSADALVYSLFFLDMVCVALAIRIRARFMLEWSVRLVGELATLRGISKENNVTEYLYSTSTLFLYCKSGRDL